MPKKPSLSQPDAPDDPEPADHPDPVLVAARDLFNKRFSAWLAARAANEDPAQPHDDDSSRKRSDALDEAVYALLATPCALRWQVWQKFELLEVSIIEDARDGIHIDNRTVLITASIKSDLIRFGFGSPSENCG